MIPGVVFPGRGGRGTGGGRIRKPLLPAERDPAAGPRAPHSRQFTVTEDSGEQGIPGHGPVTFTLKIVEKIRKLVAEMCLSILLEKRLGSYPFHNVSSASVSSFTTFIRVLLVPDADFSRIRLVLMGNARSFLKRSFAHNGQEKK